MPYRLTITTLRLRPVGWAHNADGTYRCLVDGGTVDVCDDDLRGIDPRLPKAVAYLMSQHKPAHASALLQTTINSWFATDDCRWSIFQGAPYYTGRLHSILHYDTTQQSITLQAVSYRGIMIDDFPVVVGVESTDCITRDFAWLEENYPHSTKRLYSGSALGLTESALADYVFYMSEAHPSEPVALPDILVAN